MLFKSGTTTISSPGTAVQINNTADKVKVIEVRARPGNSGDVYFGDSDVSSSSGRTLQPGEPAKVTLDEGSLLFNVFYVDGDQSGDKVDYIAILH